MPMPPAAVNDLAVISLDADAVSLGWNAAAGADSYDVYRSLVSGGGVEQALRFVFGHAGVSSVTVGTINPDHLRSNVATVERILQGAAPAEAGVRR